MTAVPNVRFLACGTSPARNISGEGNGSVIAEKCSPIHSSSKPSRSASNDFSVYSRGGSLIDWPAGCTGIMNSPIRIWLLRGLRLRCDVLAEFRHHLLGEQPHRFALPVRVRASPVDAGHQQRAERSDPLAEGNELV